MSLAAIVAASAWIAGSAQDENAPRAGPLPLLRHADLLARAREIASAHPDVARIVPVGASRAGRAIEALRIGGGDAPGKPAILVVANVEGPQVFTSALALHEADEIARRAASDGAVQAFLDRATLFVVPRANPDAAEAWFETPRSERRASGPGVDDDRDGRAGEDAPSDVDGDGLVTALRVEDPRGTWIEDPADARALVEADAAKGEVGKFRLWPEGRDLDRDEKVAEDAPLDAQVSANFAHEWRAHSAAAGRFPTDEPEARALADFVIVHPEIALVVVYGELDLLVEKPKSVAIDAPRQKLVPQPGVIEPDAKVLEELGKRYAELTGNKTKGTGDGAGSFPAWTYQHRGLWTLAIHAWDIPLDSKAKDADKKAGGEATESEQGASKEGQGKKPREPSDDAKRLEWIDANSDEAWRFVPWRAFEHPELGRVEIGGFAPGARTVPPEAQRREIAEKELAFLLTLAGDLARISLDACSAKPLGGDVYEIEVALANRSRFALASASARRTDTVRPARVQIRLPEGARLLAGEPRTLVRELAGGGARRELRWLVQCADPGAIVIEADTDHAGIASARPEVKR
jgi:hypothetical protein